jgi:hypothetical protein
VRLRAGEFNPFPLAAPRRIVHNEIFSGHRVILSGAPGQKPSKRRRNDGKIGLAKPAQKVFN